MIANLDPYNDWLFIFDTEIIPVTDLAYGTTVPYYHQRLYHFDLSTNPGSIVTPIQQEKVFEFSSAEHQSRPYHMQMIWKTGHLYIHTTAVAQVSTVSNINCVWLVSGIGSSSSTVHAYQSPTVLPLHALKTSYYSGLIYSAYVYSGRVSFTKFSVT